MKNLMIIILGGLLVTTVFIAIKASAAGAVLADLEKESFKLSQFNQELNDKIVSTTSLSTVKKEAEKMGMNKPEKFVYMSGMGIALR